MKTGENSGSFVRQAVANLDEDSKRELSTYAGKKLIDLEAKRQEQEIDLESSTRDIENHIDAFNMLSKEGRLTRQKVTSDLKSGAGNMRIESKSGASCFVATVCYGDPYHPDLDVLRRFRDEALIKYRLGNSFIDWYYRAGPKIAAYVAERRRLKALILASIRNFVIVLKAMRKKY